MAKKDYKNYDELKEAVNNGKINTMKKAIKAKCLDCSCYSTTEVSKCITTSCPLYAFRNGKNPYKKNTMSEEAKEKAKQRLLEYHKMKRDSM